MEMMFICATSGQHWKKLVIACGPHWIRKLINVFTAILQNKIHYGMKFQPPPVLYITGIKTIPTFKSRHSLKISKWRRAKLLTYKARDRSRFLVIQLQPITSVLQVQSKKILLPENIW